MVPVSGGRCRADPLSTPLLSSESIDVAMGSAVLLEAGDHLFEPVDGIGEPLPLSPSSPITVCRLSISCSITRLSANGLRTTTFCHQ